MIQFMSTVSRRPLLCLVQPGSKANSISMRGGSRLAEAIGKAGGLNDALADPASVFVYRGETRQLAQKLGIDISKFTGPIIPVVYNANLRDPAGYFLATKFQMRNKDVVFESNAIAVEQAKIMQQIRLVTATVNDPIVAATNAVILRNIVAAPRWDYVSWDRSERHSPPHIFGIVKLLIGM